MPKIKYINKRFNNESLKKIQIMNTIIDDYTEQGFQLTLRQLYYQMVAKGYIENSIKSYKSLQVLVNDARLAGKIDWHSIEDRTRNVISRSHWNSPQEIVNAVANQYHKDMWSNQDNRLEVWVEKEALIGVISGTCHKYDVPYYTCRGFNSQSEMWNAARRVIANHNEGYGTVILYLGDHDPSGIDMTRDLKSRFELFKAVVEVDRLALNIDQVEELNPPPNPAKNTDTRFKNYVQEFGNECWELDALSPVYINGLITDKIASYIDTELWQEKQDEINMAKMLLGNVAKRWIDVVKLVDN